MSDVPDNFSLSGEENYDSSDWPGVKKTWTTPEQWGWLKNTRPAYLAAQKAKNLAQYLEAMGNDFFLLWSECLLLFGHTDRSRLSDEQNEQLNEAIKKRREYHAQQLRIWHKNQDRHRPSMKPLASLLRAVGVTKKAGRLPQAQELFSKKRYKVDVKPAVQAKKVEMEANLGRKLLPGERLNNVRQCTKEAYDNTTTAVKTDIQKQLVQAKEDAQAGASGRELSLDSSRTAQQYQDAIDLTPQLLTNIIDPLCAYSGWMISLVGAGPVPEDKGKIGTISAHFGHDPKGPNFAQVTPNFEEQYVVPIGRYAKHVFSRDVQKARSLDASGSSTPSSSGQMDVPPTVPGVALSQSMLPRPGSSSPSNHVPEVAAVTRERTPRMVNSSPGPEGEELGYMVDDVSSATAPPSGSDPMPVCVTDPLTVSSSAINSPALDQSRSDPTPVCVTDLLTVSSPALAPSTLGQSWLDPVPICMNDPLTVSSPAAPSTFGQSGSDPAHVCVPVTDPLTAVYLSGSDLTPVSVTDPLTNCPELVIDMATISGEDMDRMMVAFELSDPVAYQHFMGLELDERTNTPVDTPSIAPESTKLLSAPLTTPQVSSPSEAPTQRRSTRTAAARAAAVAETPATRASKTRAEIAAPTAKTPDTRASRSRTAAETSAARAGLSRSGRGNGTRNQNKTGPPEKATEAPAPSKRRKGAPPTTAPAPKAKRPRRN